MSTKLSHKGPAKPDGHSHVKFPAEVDRHRPPFLHGLSLWHGFIGVSHKAPWKFSGQVQRIEF